MITKTVIAQASAVFPTIFRIKQTIFSLFFLIQQKSKSPKRRYLPSNAFRWFQKTIMSLRM